MARAVRSGSRVDTIVLAVLASLALLISALPAGGRGDIAALLRRTVVAPLVSLQRGAERARKAFVSYDATTRMQDSIVLRAMRVSELESENERMRKLLGLGERLRWGFVPAEALSGRMRGEEYTLNLTAGANAGVRPFSPVVAPEGLVGMVQSVDPTMSLAIVWSHPDFRVSAMAADGSAFGIVAAHLRGSGAERFLLEMSGVPFRSELKPGTLIVSSGLGGTYPRGIPVGVVLRELQTAEGWARTYLLRSAVLPPDVTTVMILQPRRAAEGGVENAWETTPPPAPPPASAVAGAAAPSADSAARRAALAEAAARRVVQQRAAAARRDSAAAAGATPPGRRPPAPPRTDTARRDPPPADTAPRPPARADTARRDTAAVTP